MLAQSLNNVQTAYISLSTLPPTQFQQLGNHGDVLRVPAAGLGEEEHPGVGGEGGQEVQGDHLSPAQGERLGALCCRGTVRCQARHVGSQRLLRGTAVSAEDRHPKTEIALETTTCRLRTCSGSKRHQAIKAVFRRRSRDQDEIRAT